MSSKKVVLIVPPTMLLTATFPFGLGYMAAILNNLGHSVSICNFTQNKYSLPRVIKKIIELAPDVLGITVYSFSYRECRDIVHGVKRINSRITIVVGGPHISVLPKESLEDLKADFAVVGEAERIFPKLIAQAGDVNSSFEGISGLAYWLKGQAVLNEGHNIIDDLDSLPFPAWELMPPDKYNDFASEISSMRMPVAPILTSRGCPHRCTFCTAHFVTGYKQRMRSAKNVIDEMEWLIRKYRVQEFLIFDDNFTGDKSHAVSICEEILKRELDIVWRCAVGVRVNSLDAELLELMKKSGCYQLSLGIETTSDDVLNRSRKSLSFSTTKEKLSLIEKFGFETVGFFVFGLPGETTQSIKDTISFVRNSNIDLPVFSKFVPFPGTKCFKEKFKGKMLNDINWNQFFVYGSQESSFCSVRAKDLDWFCFYAYFLTYTNPFRLFKLIKKLVSSKNVRYNKFFKFIKCIISSLVKP
ncbi:MAG: radical SAM protein [Candidatus Omnitrophota bacterium]